jgi:hypothetical protein
MRPVISDGELPMSELGDGEDLVFGICWVLLMVSWLMVVVGFVAVGGFAGLVSGSHIHGSCMFAGSTAICGDTTGPAFTVAGGGSIGVSERLVFDVWIGVGGEAPDPGDLLGHWDEMLMWKNARAMFGREQSFYS